MRNLNKLALVAAAGILLSACSSPVQVTETAPVSSHPLATSAPAATGDVRDVHTVDTGSSDSLSDPTGALAKRSVYFDFDSYAVRNDGKRVVEGHSSYLNKNKGRHILIQGNTDERGGTEYNLALGQKRAEAVRKAMAALGVPESQMEAVSLGEAKPKMSGRGEAAWAENRRADIVY